MNTKKIRDGLGQNFIDNVTAFVRKRVIPQEEYYCFYLRRDKRHFEEYSNSAHEGMNNAIKNCSSPVKPSHHLDHYMQILSRQGERSVANKKRQYNSSTDACKIYLTLRCTDKLTKIAAEMLESAWLAREHLKVIRVTENFYLAIYDNPEVLERILKNSIFPVFRRVFRIRHDDDSCLKCSCRKFERMGLPCSHIYVVTKLASNY